MKSLMPKNDTKKKYESILISEKQDIPRQLIDYWMKLAHTNISNICNPLLEFGITYFLYIKKFDDGSQIELTNNIPWSEYYYQKSYCFLDPFQKNIEYPEKSKFLWTGLSCQEILNDMRQFFHIDHGFTMTTKLQDSHEVFHFGGNKNNPQLINFFLNKEYILKRFILYFKDKLDHLIKQCEKKRIVLVKDNISDIQKNISYSKMSISQKFSESMPIDKYYLGEDSHTYLTKREIECLKWHFAGKTAYDISMLLNISKRTAEIHLENSRHKLNCLKQSQLGYKLSGLIDAL